jgi:hypothetical protein
MAAVSQALAGQISITRANELNNKGILRKPNLRQRFVVRLSGHLQQQHQGVSRGPHGWAASCCKWAVVPLLIDTIRRWQLSSLRDNDSSSVPLDVMHAVCAMPAILLIAVARYA